jgi:hypothetical protein
VGAKQGMAPMLGERWGEMERRSHGVGRRSAQPEGTPQRKREEEKQFLSAARGRRACEEVRLAICSVICGPHTNLGRPISSPRIDGPKENCRGYYRISGPCLGPWPGWP